MAMDTQISRTKANKFLSRKDSIKKRSLLQNRKPSISFSKDDDDDMNLHKYLRVKSKESSKEGVVSSLNVVTSMSTNIDAISNRKSLADTKPEIPLLKL